MKSRSLLLCTVALLLPVGLKYITPALIQRIPPSSQSQGWTVARIEGNMLSLSKGNTSTRVQLAGLAATPPHWRSEAMGIQQLLYQSSNGEVEKIEVGVSSTGVPLVLLRLPNGTLVQSVLLQDGVARLGEARLLPPAVATQLKQDERQAQQQRKNIWGEG